MNVFSASDEPRTEIGTATAAGRVLQGLRDLHPPRSLAELSPDDGDFDWLRSWARGLTTDVAHRWLADHFNPTNADIPTAGPVVPHQAGIGLLLLFLHAELARRLAVESNLWPNIRRHAGFRPDVMAMLFAQGQPTSAHKAAIEAAVRFAGLRHVFDAEGAQRWFGVVFLQCGFSERGAKDRLRDWLAGNYELSGSVTVRRLLRGNQASDGFRRLWESLRGYAVGNRNEAQIRQSLGSSPWVLPAWSNLMVAEAAKGLRGGHASTTHDDGGDDEETLPPAFLARPRLVWDGAGPPTFVTQVRDLSAIPLTAEAYTLKIGEVDAAHLYRAADGGYDVEPPSDLPVPADGSRCHARLVPFEESADEWPIELDLWDAAQDAQLFAMPAGTPLEPGASIKQGAAYALLVGPDLSVTPTPENWAALGNDGHTIYWLNAGDAAHATVTADGQPVWRAANAGVAGEPAWAADCRVSTASDAGQPWGKSYRLVVHRPAGSEVAFFRVGGRPVKLMAAEPGDRDVLSAPIEMPVGSAATRLVCRVGLRLGGATTCVTRDVRLRPYGVARRAAEGWQPVPASETLSVRDLRNGLFRIVPDIAAASAQPEAGERDWALVEGDTFQRRVPRAATALGPMAGLGASLVALPGPFNAVVPGTVVCRSVVDPGIVDTYTIETAGPDDPPAPRRLRVTLHNPLRPGERHRMVWWDRTGTLHVLTPQSFESAEAPGRVWDAVLDDELTEPVAVAVAYDGVRLGARWADDWGETVLSRRATADAAFCVRWFRLPILHDGCLAAVRRFVLTSGRAADLLVAWLNEGPTAEHGLRIVDDRESWMAALRRVYVGWTMTREEAEAIVDRLGGLPDAEPADRMGRAAQALLEIDPRLAVHLVAAWCVPLKNQRGRPVARENILRLACTICGVAGPHLLDIAKGRLPFDCAKLMHVSEAFVTTALLRPALQSGATESDRTQRNVNLAMGVRPFRTQVAVELLSQLAGTF